MTTPRTIAIPPANQSRLGSSIAEFLSTELSYRKALENFCLNMEREIKAGYMDDPDRIFFSKAIKDVREILKTNPIASNSTYVSAVKAIETLPAPQKPREPTEPSLPNNRKAPRPLETPASVPAQEKYAADLAAFNQNPLVIKYQQEVAVYESDPRIIEYRAQQKTHREEFNPLLKNGLDQFSSSTTNPEFADYYKKFGTVIAYSSVLQNAVASLEKKYPQQFDPAKKEVNGERTLLKALFDDCITPMQRSTRYPLLAKTILSHLTEGSPEHNQIAQVNAIMNATTKDINANRQINRAESQAIAYLDHAETLSRNQPQALEQIAGIRKAFSSIKEDASKNEILASMANLTDQDRVSLSPIKKVLDNVLQKIKSTTSPTELEALNKFKDKALDVIVSESQQAALQQANKLFNQFVDLNAKLPAAEKAMTDNNAKALQKDFQKELAVLQTNAKTQQAELKVLSKNISSDLLKFTKVGQSSRKSMSQTVTPTEITNLRTELASTSKQNLSSTKLEVNQLSAREDYVGVVAKKWANSPNTVLLNGALNNLANLLEERRQIAAVESKLETTQTNRAPSPELNTFKQELVAAKNKIEGELQQAYKSVQQQDRIMTNNKRSDALSTIDFKNKGSLLSTFLATSKRLFGSTDSKPVPTQPSTSSKVFQATSSTAPTLNTTAANNELHAVIHNHKKNAKTLSGALMQELYDRKNELMARANEPGVDKQTQIDCGKAVMHLSKNMEALGQALQEMNVQDMSVRMQKKMGGQVHSTGVRAQFEVVKEVAVSLGNNSLTADIASGYKNYVDKIEKDISNTRNNNPTLDSQIAEVRRQIATAKISTKGGELGQLEHKLSQNVALLEIRRNLTTGDDYAKTTTMHAAYVKNHAEVKAFCNSLRAPNSNLDKSIETCKAVLADKKGPLLDEMKNIYKQMLTQLETKKVELAQKEVEASRPKPVVAAVVPEPTPPPVKPEVREKQQREWAPASPSPSNFRPR